MNWEAAGSLGEIIGAIAVVISVIYLAVQVRKQTEESRLGATRELSAQYHEIVEHIHADREFSEIWLAAVDDYEALPNQQRIRASVYFQRIMRMAEQEYLHTSKRKLDPEYFESLRNVTREFLTFPGPQQWWEGNRYYFGKAFQQHIDTLLEGAKTKGYVSSFKDEREAPRSQT